MEKTIKSTVEHCVYCFDMLLASLNKQTLPPFPQSIPNVKAPLFVTWESKGDLRGCIGTFSQQELAVNLGKYALIAALKDTRFEPIQKSQLPDLSVAVSLLVNFQKREDAMDWEVGKHGIQIDFLKNGRDYRGTFLPEVAQQNGWSKEETLKHLVRKAGYTRSLDTVLSQIHLTSYESSKTKLAYQEYLGHKQ